MLCVKAPGAIPGEPHAGQVRKFGECCHQSAPLVGVREVGNFNRQSPHAGPRAGSG